MLLNLKLKEVLLLPRSNNKRSQAVFVVDDIAVNKSFIYYLRFITLLGLNTKRRLMSFKDDTKRLLSRIAFSKLIGDFTVWLAEALIEGLTANIATSVLLGWDFNFLMVLAHGISIKQTISFYWSLRKDGATTTILKQK